MHTSCTPRAHRLHTLSSIRPVIVQCLSSNQCESEWFRQPTLKHRQRGRSTGVFKLHRTIRTYKVNVTPRHVSVLVYTLVYEATTNRSQGRAAIGERCIQK